jgi:hypothetical protein
MVISKQRMVAVAIGLAAMALSSPSQAQGRYDAQGHYIISAARAAAIHECSVRASQYPEYDWGTMATYQYRACMAEHGQQE